MWQKLELKVATTKIFFLVFIGGKNNESYLKRYLSYFIVELQ